jgi:hypothetical protein
VCPSRIYSIQDKHTNVSIFLFSDSGQRIGVGVGAKTGATPFFHAGAVLMMRLLYWLWLPPLFLGLYSKKNPIYQVLIFFTDSIGLRIGVDRTGAL